MVRSWAFWADPLALPKWIGPRHTNYPDGSVCAFEPSDGTWSFGDPLVDLLDIYAVWAVRHLHLQAFGRWPGRQAVHRACERIMELQADEYCGCAAGDKRYGECCEKKDKSESRVTQALQFFWKVGGYRQPPDELMTFVRYGTDVPDLRAVMPTLSAANLVRTEASHLIAWSAARTG